MALENWLYRFTEFVATKHGLAEALRSVNGLRFDAFASDDKVVMRCTVRGTNTRAWMGHQPTGKSFLVDHIHIYRLEGNRIAEHWGVRDDLGMLRQLGHVG